MAESRHAVLGVIGHVDHGKTALVRALTGTEIGHPEEEQRRGIFIVLGYAQMQVAGATIDLIDRPGRERFVGTMVFGATGIDAALFVVTANEGVKPQTVEHLDIAGLLDVRSAIMVVTKADLVTPSRQRALQQQRRSWRRMRAYPCAPGLSTSAHSGVGIDELRAILAGVASDGITALDDGFPYLPVDRVFSMRGHGTVITGTLRRGCP